MDEMECITIKRGESELVFSHDALLLHNSNLEKLAEINKEIALVLRDILAHEANLPIRKDECPYEYMLNNFLSVSVSIPFVNDGDKEQMRDYGLRDSEIQHYERKDLYYELVPAMTCTGMTMVWTHIELTETRKNPMHPDDENELSYGNCVQYVNLTLLTHILDALHGGNTSVMFMEGYTI